MQIGELAKIVNASVRSIRYYEEQGLLRSQRSTRGQRVYDVDAVWRVQTIQRLYAAGLSSKSIRNLGTCIAPRLLTPAQLDGLHQELHQIDEQAAALRAARGRLTAILDSAEPTASGIVAAGVLPGPPRL